jgi:hypothetical protein
MTCRGISGLHRVPALVYPGVDAHSVAAGSALHELPHAYGIGPADRIVGVAALDQREI